ncbi:hypothetical protein GF376_03955 [Candidatus Peregrinibacteria bacterium]|nr:hypothetical protein [Candidatus Peregrinibacteria bacterium]
MRKRKWDLKKILVISGLGLISLGILGILIFFAAIAVLSIGLPDVEDLENYAVAQSTTIYDREGNPLYVKFGEENREYVSLEQMSPNIINATLAIEDEHFYEHAGFDLFGVARAAITNLTTGSSQGASTITQQYIKWTFLTPEKSYIRKMKELILAVRLEETYDKDTILEKYLNRIPYGNNAFGVEKAAETYFDKDASELTIAESAILAAIPQAPSYYNPYGPHQRTKLDNPEEVNSENDIDNDNVTRGLIGSTVILKNDQEVYLIGRTDLVLNRMVEAGMITENQKEEAQLEAQNIEFEKYKQSITAPHFVFHIINQLERRYGSELVEQGGLKVYTTLDPKLQEAAEEVISERAESNETNYNVKNAALVSLNPNTGEILAMVGSRDYFDEEIDGQTNIVTSFRQPGSSFKPIVFAQAFQERYTPASVIFDVATPFGSDTPKNYDGTFLGPISIRQALAQSRNIPAVKAFFLAGGQDPIMNLAKAMGVVFRDEEVEYGYPFALGTAETTLLSMANAYGTFASGGWHLEPVSILRVENAQGEIIEEWQNTQAEEALDPQIAYLITSILSDKNYRIGPNLTVEGHTNAAKTGTSNIRKNGRTLPNDLLTIGYTPDLVTAVWAGNNDSRKDGYLAASASGYTVAAPIFKKYMDNALADSPNQDFPIPEGIRQETVSKTTGKLAGDLTPPDQQYTEFFASFAVPTEIDDSYKEIPDYTSVEKLANVICQAGESQKQFRVEYHDIDPERTVWEEAAQKWLEANPEVSAQLGTKLGCQSIPEEMQPSVEIANMDDGEYINDNNIEVKIRPSTKSGVAAVHFYLDGTLRYQETKSPFEGLIRLPRNSTANEHTITVRLYDNDGNIAQDQVTITTVRQSNQDNNNDDQVEDDEETETENN